jgi:hypothetical protein
MRFVTDFLWRSPLGLRINAQDTAGVTQTEDWVKIAAGSLPRNGAYDIRITAELWETHFFDHVSLLVVDHPAETEVFVDERFSPAHPPSLDVKVMARHRLLRVHGTRREGRYRSGDTPGRPVPRIVQARRVSGDRPGSLRRIRGCDTRIRTLIANGWIYPTDSSINVAIGQGGHVTPSGLALEARRHDGRWVVVNPDVGFPAGKNKTILVDLSQVPAGATRLRLRTNLEIYWDQLSVAERSAEEVKTTRLPAVAADLAFRGYSQTTSPRGAAPETPDYQRVANTTQRWRDLVGYYTRFGM